MSELEELFEPFLSMGEVNDRPSKLLRDTGTTLDIISAREVEKDQYTGETVCVKLYLENSLRGIPITQVKLELQD